MTADGIGGAANNVASNVAGGALAIRSLPAVWMRSRRAGLPEADIQPVTPRCLPGSMPRHSTGYSGPTKQIDIRTP